MGGGGGAGGLSVVFIVGRLGGSVKTLAPDGND